MCAISYSQFQYIDFQVRLVNARGYPKTDMVSYISLYSSILFLAKIEGAFILRMYTPMTTRNFKEFLSIK
jgi:hypothetical protein